MQIIHEGSRRSTKENECEGIQFSSSCPMADESPFNRQPSQIQRNSAKALVEIEPTVVQILMNNVIAVFANLVCQGEITGIDSATGGDAVHQPSHLRFGPPTNAMQPIVAKYRLEG